MFSSTAIVELNPQKFYITNSELESRKQFITQTRISVQSVIAELNDPSTKMKADKIFRRVIIFIFISIF